MLFQPLLHTAIFVCVSISAAMTGLTNNTCTATGHQGYGGACPELDATVNAEQGAQQEVNSTCTYSRYKLSTGIGVSGQQTFKKPEPLLGCTRFNPNCAAGGSSFTQENENNNNNNNLQAFQLIVLATYPHKRMQAGIVTLMIGNRAKQSSLTLASALLPYRMAATSSL